MTSENKPKVNLSTVDGNAFFILAACQKAARKEGWTQSKIDDFLDEAKSGNYDHLLQTCHKHFEVE